MKELTGLFLKLEKEQWSGEVEVNSTEGSAFILIHKGQFIWAHRSLDRSIERLERLSWLDLPPEEVLRSAKTWEELVQALIRSNQPQYHRLVRYLKSERQEIFYRTFFWSNVEMIPRAFEFQLPDPVEFGFYTKRKLSSQVREAEKRLLEWPSFQQLIGSSKRIFVRQTDLDLSPKSEADEIDKALGSTNPEVVIGAQSFSLEELEILRLCDGTHNVQDLIRLTGIGEFLTIRRVIELWDRGVIAPKDDESTIHRRVKAKSEWTLKAALSSALLLVLLCSLNSAVDRLQKRSSSGYVSSTAVQQRLELFRRKEGRYPLNLQELSVERPIDPLYLNQFEYKLLNPFKYQLMVR